MLKAFRAYQVHGELNADLSGINEYVFRTCSEQELERVGFVPVMNEHVTHNVSGSNWFRIKKEKKQIPASSVADQLKTLVSVFENEHGRKPGKKEKSELKEKVVIDLASRALPSISYIDGYFNNDVVVILTSSASAAEDAMALLRKALGSLPVGHYLDSGKLSESLQSWFRGDSLPQNVKLGHEVKLSTMDEEKSTATIKNDALQAEEIQALLSARRVVSLELEIADKASFLIKDDGAFTKISVSDVALEAHNNEQGDVEGDAAQMEANMILKSAIVADILGTIEAVRSSAPTKE